MNSIVETLNQSGGQFLQFAWPMLWQSSLLIGFVLALDFLLARKIRASVRYALWLAVLVKLLLPPTLALPTGAAWWLFYAQPVVKAPVIKSYTVTYDTTPLADYVPPTVALPPPAPPQLNGAGWALLATSVISAGLLLWLALRWWQVARMVRGAMASEGLVDLMAEVQRQAGLRSRLRLKLIEGRMSPAVCGLFRPVILLPRTLAEQLSPAQLRAVLLHEAFHLRRKDVWVNCAQALLQIVYWWHPLLWIANARIRRVREEAVDDAVMLALREEAEGYAPTLLEVAKLAFRRPLMSLGLVGIMESRSALRQRIERLVDFRAPRKAGLTFASLCGICVFSAVALPMGEAPSPATAPASMTTAVGEQSLTLNVNPEIFIRNIKAQVPKTLLAPTNDYTVILDNLLRSEDFECAPPHGIAFNTKTGAITTQNTPDKLDIFQRVIEQLNRADGVCELPLHNNFHRKSVVIEASLYAMTDGQFDKFTTGLHRYAGGSIGDPWWSVPPEDFKQFINSIETSDLQRIQHPRIQTASGTLAEFFVGNGTNNVEFDCKPIAEDGFVDLTLRGAAINGVPGNWVTNQFASHASAQEHGGIVVRMENYDGQADVNFVAVISAEILTNVLPHSHERLQTIIRRSGGDSNFLAAAHAAKQQTGIKTLPEPEVTTTSERSINQIATPISAPIANATNKLLYTGSGRQGIIDKLFRIRLDTVSFDNLPLSEVLRILAKQSKLRDPDHEGINFLINSNPDKSGPAIDPATGMPLAPTQADTNSEPVDVGSFIVKIPSLTNVCLMDVLDAIVTVCDHPIKYSIPDFAVVFSAKGPEVPQLFSRSFRVDSFFIAALQNMPGLQTNSVSAMAQSFFTKMDVDFESPKGKSVFYNDRLGRLFVKATESDLDIIERAILANVPKNPQIHLKARFLEVPKGLLRPISSWTNLVENFEGILPNTSAKIALQALEKRGGVMILAQPEVTTTSGRQTQVRATQTVTIITNFVFEEFPTNHDGSVGTSSVTPKTGPIETGPIFDVVPRVLSDGYTLDLQMTASSMEFYGYADSPTNIPPPTVTTSTGETVVLPRVWPAVLRYQKSAHVNLFDGQTVILSLTNPEQVRFGEPDEKREAAVAKLIRDSASHNGGRNDILVFVTATIVDQAGNRVHSDGDLPFAQTSVPSQPQKAVSGYFDDMNPNEQRSGRTQ